MPQTRDGAIKIAAARVGVTEQEYRLRLSAGLKHCRVCRVWQPVSAFNVDRSRYDGLAALCRLCQKGGPKQLALIKPTPAEIQRHRYATDPEYRHRTKQRVYARKRSIAPISYEDAQFHLDRTDGLCLYCDNPATSWDHMVPVSKGGRTERHNMAPCCTSCNSRKKDRNFHDFVISNDLPLTPRLISFMENAVSIGQLEP